MAYLRRGGRGVRGPQFRDLGMLVQICGEPIVTHPSIRPAGGPQLEVDLYPIRLYQCEDTVIGPGVAHFRPVTNAPAFYRCRATT